MTNLDVPGGLALALASVIACGAWRQWAVRRGVVDTPGHRRSHAVVTPRGAGIPMAILIGLVAVAMGLHDQPATASAMLSCLAAAWVGAWDDFRPLSAGVKFAAQSLAALPAAIMLPLLPDLFPPALGIAASWILLVGLVNVWNFMDGSNGMIALQTLSILAFAMLYGIGVLQPLAGAVLAVTLGFLVWNFPRGRLFLGDSGSFLLGMGVGVSLLAGLSEGPRHGLPVLALFAACVVDTAATLLWRACRRQKLAEAHRDHLYQRLIQSGYSHARVASLYGVWTVALGLCGWWVVGSGGHGVAWPLLAFPLAATVWWILHGRAQRRSVAGGA